MVWFSLFLHFGFGPGISFDFGPKHGPVLVLDWVGLGLGPIIVWV